MPAMRKTKGKMMNLDFRLNARIEQALTEAARMLPDQIRKDISSKRQEMGKAAALELTLATLRKFVRNYSPDDTPESFGVSKSDFGTVKIAYALSSLNPALKGFASALHSEMSEDNGNGFSGMKYMSLEGFAVTKADKERHRFIGSIQNWPAELVDHIFEDL